MDSKQIGIRVVLAFVTLLGIGCDRPQKGASLPRHQIMKINLFPPPESLDPRIGGETRSLPVTRMLFEGLLRLDLHDEPALALARSFEVSPCGRVYTFHLRPTTWSNGDPVTAYDFEYAWKWVIGPDSPSNFGLYFYPLLNAKKAKEGRVSMDEVGVRAVDEMTLVVTLNHPAPYFPQLVASPPYAPVSKRWEEEHPRWASSSEHFLSNGPFLLRESEPGSRFVFEKNPRYWDADQVELEVIEASLIDDGYTAYLMYEQGELDFIGDPLCALPLECALKLEEEGTLITQPIDGIFRVDFNTEHFPLDNQKIRQALSFAIDREELVANVLKGGGEVATSPLPPNLTLSSSPLIGADAKACAVALFEEGLEECGLTRETFPRLAFIYWAMGGHKATAQAIQQQWKRTLGIKVDIQGCEFGVRRQRILAGDFDCTTTTWFSFYHDPVYSLNLYRKGDYMLNYTRWEDSRFRELLEASDQSPIGREAYLQAAEILIAEGSPSAPIYAPSFRYATHAEGVYLSPVGHIDLKWARLPRGR
ncbi:MAG: peptide ABC transporter substrate-binding protein [Parachlamydiales bacterium]